MDVHNLGILYFIVLNQLEKLEAAKAVYPCVYLWLLLFGYLWLLLVTFGYLWLPLWASQGLILGLTGALLGVTRPYWAAFAGKKNSW